MKRPSLAGLLADLAPSAHAALQLRACDRVGLRPRVHGSAHVENRGHLEVGDRFLLESSPVQSHLVTGPRGRLEIGHDVSIGHGAAIAAHAHVQVGNRVQMGAFVMVMDTDFHDAVHRDVMPEGQPILIGHGVRIGARVTVLRGTVIGEGAEVEAGSVVSGEVPPHTVVGGVPARVLRRVGEAPGALPQVAAEAQGSVLARVGQVVQLTFGLPQVPPPEAGPGQVRGWDSLGSLKLLLALEDAFGVSLSEDEMARARTLAELGATLEAALARRKGAHAA